MTQCHCTPRKTNPLFFVRAAVIVFVRGEQCSPSRVICNSYQVSFCDLFHTSTFTRLDFELMLDHLQIRRQSQNIYPLWIEDIRLAAPQQLSPLGELFQKGPSPLLKGLLHQMQTGSQHGEPFETPLPHPKQRLQSLKKRASLQSQKENNLRNLMISQARP